MHTDESTNPPSIKCHNFHHIKVKNLPAMQETQERQVQSLGWETPRGGNGNPLQYSCLGNLIDRGAWWSTVHRLQRVRHDRAMNTASLQSDYDHFYH